MGPFLDVFFVTHFCVMLLARLGGSCLIKGGKKSNATLWICADKKAQIKFVFSHKIILHTFIYRKPCAYVNGSYLKLCFTCCITHKMCVFKYGVSLSHVKYLNSEAARKK